MGHRRRSSRNSGWSSNRQRSSSDASERARLAHIKAAEEFSYAVGGSDDIVKKAFFDLSHDAFLLLLDSYEQRFGKPARDYALKAISAWRSGKRRMSGIVAKRLFDLMPPLMQLSEKHKIVEVMWKKFGPSPESQ